MIAKVVYEEALSLTEKAREVIDKAMGCGEDFDWVKFCEMKMAFDPAIKYIQEQLGK